MQRYVQRDPVADPPLAEDLLRLLCFPLLLAFEVGITVYGWFVGPPAHLLSRFK